MKTYSQHIRENENGKKEIYPFDYLEFYVDNIQPYTQFEDSPEKIYEGITEDDFYKSHPNGFSDLFKLLLHDKRLSQLQDELETEHKQVCLFNISVLSQFLIERGKSRYLYLSRPTISDTLAELKNVSKITFTNTDGSTVESKSTTLIKKVMETLEAEKESDALKCEVDKIVTWDDFADKSILQSYFVHDLAMFLNKYFPIKRKKDALISTKEVELILYLMKIFGLSAVELTNKRYWQLMKIHKAIKSATCYGEMTINGKKSVAPVFFIPYSIWKNGKIEWTEDLPNFVMKEGMVVTFFN